VSRHPMPFVLPRFLQIGKTCLALPICFFIL